MNHVNEEPGLLHQALDPSEIVGILNRLQQREGFIRPEALAHIASRFNLPESQLHGLVSFFSVFRSTAPGKHRLQVCCGTACYARGSSRICERLCSHLHLSTTDTSSDALITVEKVSCVGACSAAPVLLLDGEIRQRFESSQIPLLVEELRAKDTSKNG